MSAPSTVNSAQPSVKTKTTAPAKDTRRVELCRQITEELLKKFPVMESAPDILFWLMATWGAESGWKLHHPKKSSGGVILNSLHYTPTNPYQKSSRIIGKGYQFSNVITNLWNDPLVTTQVRENIKEGWYPHGVTACMGAYHVKGCPNNKQEWRAYSEAVKLIEQLDLEVEPGESIFQKLFPTEDEASIRRSIASGMIIFHSKYRAGLNSGRSPAAAIQYALGAYLGNAGIADANGVTPEMRVAQLNGINTNIMATLKEISLSKSSDTTVLAADTTNKSSKASGANTVQNVAAAPATTSANSNGKSGKKPGCAAA